MQAAATRERLLQAAVEVFSESGYQAATAASIYERAGTSHCTFYVYFRNRDDAFGQVIERVLGTMATAAELDPSKERYEGLVEQIRGYLEVFVQYRGLM